MELTEFSETLAYKIQTQGNYPEESKQNSEQGESLKSKIVSIYLVLVQPNKIIRFHVHFIKNKFQLIQLNFSHKMAMAVNMRNIFYRNLHATSITFPYNSLGLLLELTVSNVNISALKCGYSTAVSRPSVGNKNLFLYC
jgi:hypothetical protein